MRDIGAATGGGCFESLATPKKSFQRLNDTDELQKKLDLEHPVFKCLVVPMSCVPLLLLIYPIWLYGDCYDR